MNELQNLIDVAKGRPLTATGKEQDHLLTFVTSCINAQSFLKWADEEKAKKEEQKMEDREETGF